MERIKFFVLILSGLLYVQFLTAQNTKKEIDSLSNAAGTAPDSLKFDIYNRMAFHYIFSDSTKADSILKGALIEARERENLYAEVLLTNTYGIQYDVNQSYDSAYYYFDKALALSRKHNFKTLEARSLNNLGMNAWNQGRLSEAQEYFFKALETSKTFFPDRRTDSFLNNIGLIYQELEQIDIALDYHYKALAERKERNIKIPQIASLNNIGICHRILKNQEKAVTAFDEGIRISEEEGAFQRYQSLYNNKGNSLIDLKAYPEAIEAFKKAKNKPQEGILNTKISFLGTSGLAYAYFLNGNLSQAKQEMNEAFAVLKESPDYGKNAESLYKVASALYLAEGSPEKGAQYIDSLQVILQNRFSDKNATALANAETKYKTAQKEATLAKTRAALAETELDLNRRNNVIYGVLAFALILGLLGYLVYNQQRLKNRQQAKEYALQNALDKIETQNKLQEQRLRISRDLHDNIGSQLTFITSSLDNLKYGMDEKQLMIKNKITEIGSFTKTTINELRDTIWAMNKEFITLDELEERLANLLEQIRSASPNLELDFRLENTISRETPLTSVEGVNIYRIIQEATTNTVKYANATTLKILITTEDKGLSLVVEDDGKGFDSDASTLGNGLRNMKKRAIDIGATLEVSSSISGTVIQVQLPQ